MKAEKAFWLLVLTSLVLSLSISCETMDPSTASPKGPSFRNEDAAQLRPGMSVEEVTKILGFKPQSRLTHPNGNTEMTWSDRIAGGIDSPGKEENKAISILFGPDGKMIKVTQKRGF